MFAWATVVRSPEVPFFTRFTVTKSLEPNTITVVLNGLLGEFH